MSEDSFVITYNDRTNFQTLTDIYESCHKLKNEVTLLRKKNIELEGELVQQKNLNSVVDRKLQRALQDVEHYKMKKLIEKPAIVVTNDESMDIDYDGIYSSNEESLKIQKQLSLEMMNCELEHKYKELEQNKFDLQQEIENMTIKYDNLKNSHDELKSFVESKKAELLELNDLKMKINVLNEMDLEISSNNNGNCESSIYLSLAKNDELQVKCFKLENENKKFKENHMNLLLLVEENTSLINKCERLEERLIEYENQTVIINNPNDCLSSMSNVQDLAARKSRHLERENEILKSEQTQLLEKNSEFVAKINLLNQKMCALKQRDNTLQALFEQKNEQIEMINSDYHYLTRECESLKKVLFQFSNQTSLDEESVTELIGNLRELYDLVDGHQITIQHQRAVLDDLTNVVKSRLDQLDKNGAQFSFEEALSGDRKMIIELRQQVEHLQDELEKKTAVLNGLDRSNRIENIAIDSSMEDDNVACQHYYSEMGFCKDAALNTDNEKNRKIFKKLSNDLLEAVKKIFGYSLELGPNGYFTVQSCFVEDSSQLLEFKIENEPILIDNAYSLSLRKQMDFKENFPALLASITLGLMEQKSLEFVS